MIMKKITPSKLNLYYSLRLSNLQQHFTGVSPPLKSKNKQKTWGISET